MFGIKHRAFRSAPSAVPPSKDEQVRRSIRRHAVAGTSLVALLAAAGGVFAATAELAGAVVAPGVLVVESNIKKVQHPTGGVIGEVRARDGDRVEAGDVLVRLDDTVTKANLAVVSKEQDALLARHARLQAERDGAATIAFPAALTVRMDDETVQGIVDGEQRLFDMRRKARDGLKAQLTERIAQLEKEIEGTVSQQDANVREIALVEQELVGVRQLWDKKLVQLTRLVAMERQLAQLEGLRGQLAGAVARLRGTVSETRLQIVQIDRDLGTEVGQAIRDAESQIGELVEQRAAAEDVLRRVDIRAPQSGVVHQSTVHTVGGVIVADGQPIMLIVPGTDELAVEARVNPQDIDQIVIGGPAKLRFSAFNQRTTPELSGSVSRVSADVSHDPVSGAPFYTVQISIPKDEVASLGDVKLMPGMPVETFVETGARSVASYLMKPFSDQLARSFRAS